MFQILITPPEHDAASRQSQQQLHAQQQRQHDAAMAELRASGVSERLLQMAAAQSMERATAAPRPIVTARPELPAPTRPTRSASGDELMGVGDEQPSASSTAPVAPQPQAAALPSGLSTMRVAGVLCPRTHMDGLGFLLPPVANPDLTPQLSRADSFFVGDEEQRPAGERNLKEMYAGRNSAAAAAIATTVAAAASPPSLALSKTRTPLASAMQPYSAAAAAAAGSVRRAGMAAASASAVGDDGAACWTLP